MNTTSKNAIVPFHSSALQEAVSSARPVLEGYNDARDSVSEDIKALESYLQGIGIAHEYRLGLGKSIEPYGTQAEIASAIEFGGGTNGKIVENAIVWGEYQKGKWRLLHEVSRWEGSIDIELESGPYFWDEETLQRDERPLIETKLETRIECYKHLPSFIKGFAKSLHIPQLNDLPETDEVPF